MKPVVLRDLVKAAKIWHAARTLSDQEFSKADKYLSKVVRRLLVWEKQAKTVIG